MSTNAKPYRVCRAGQMALRFDSEVEARTAAHECSTKASSQGVEAHVWVDARSRADRPALLATYRAGRDVLARSR